MKVDKNIFFDALKHDKKNTSNAYCFILPISLGTVEKTYLPFDEKTDSLIQSYFSKVYGKYSEALEPA